MQQAIFQQNNVWEAWGGTGTCNSCTTDRIRLWTDTGTSATNVTVTEGLTAAANYVWGTEEWQVANHSPARWTPRVYERVPAPVRTPM